MSNLSNSKFSNSSSNSKLNIKHSTLNNDIAIKVQNLTKTYKLYKEPVDRLKEALNPFRKKYHKDFYALKNISFEIEKGKTIGIIGKNGSGKSTLLKIIAGVLNATSGDLLVNGKISAILELGSGFNPEMSGIENIYLNSAINGLSKKDINKKIDNIIDFAELGAFIYQPLKTYSSGMKARLAFALAVNVDPDIFIVDEALAVGDAAFQRKCFAKMEQIRDTGATILFVSHSESNIVNLCSHVIWLHCGEKILEGKPKLVTGLYMKNSNKQHIDKKIIVKEFDELKKSESRVKNIRKEQKHILEKKYFDPSLKPKSTIYYEENGAKIFDVEITTLNGKRVNILLQGEKYIYSYKVSIFNSKIKELNFGCLIKNKQGIFLGGGAYPDKKNFVRILNKNYLFKFEFTCTLQSGEYFFNAGIRNQTKYVHRIVDAYIFKVINYNQQLTSSVKFFNKILIEEI